MKPRIIDVFPDVLENGGIFTKLNLLNVPWKNDIDGESLDIEYMMNISGQKSISPLVNYILSGSSVLSDENITKLANTIYNLNIRNWTKIYNTLSLVYNPINNYDMTETETIERETSDTATHTGTVNATRTGTVNATHTGTVNETHTGTVNEQHTGTVDTSNTGTVTETHTGTSETEHTGTEQNTSSESAQGSGSGSTENSIYGFNSTSAVDDSSSDTTTSNTNTASGTSTRTDNLSDLVTNDLEDERTDALRELRTNNLADSTTNNLADSTTNNLTDLTTNNLTDLTTNNLSDSASGTVGEDRTLTRSGNIGVTTSQQMIQAERDLWVWNFFYQVVFKDVDRSLTISTYSNRSTSYSEVASSSSGDSSQIINAIIEATDEINAHTDSAVSIVNTNTNTGVSSIRNDILTVESSEY